MVYDIFYVSKNIISDKDWKKFRLRFPSAQKINNVKSFSDVKKKAFTKLFWIVWDDLEIVENFDFSYRVPEWDQDFIHVWLNSTTYDGVGLFSKNSEPTQKEFENRFYVNKKEIATIASVNKQYEKFIISNYKDYLEALETTTLDMFWGIWSGVEVINQKIFDISFKHRDVYDKGENHVFKNACNDQISFVNGVALFSKNKPVSKKEIEYRFLINKKEYDIVASQNRYPKYIISNYNEYLNICQTEKQPLFWCIWPDIDIIDNTIFNFYFDPFDGQYDYDRSVNHMFKNKVGDEESFISGVALCSPNKVVSKKEIEHRFFLDKKEQDRLVSSARPYERFVLDTFKDYEHALTTANTDMFWSIPIEVEPLADFDFSLHFPYQNNYERSINHVFKNKDVEEIKYNGIMLLSKHAPISSREMEYRYLIEKKEYDVVASKLKLYDIIFISYNEPNADENFANLLERFPRAKRVHGVKGIHQAHIAAAKIATTPMFWVVDGDAIVENDFVFDLLLPKHDTDIVHVWLSRNPINNLTYGYGGVKLLPRNLTKNMDLSKPSIDMTMSISNKFKVIQIVSNITAFNTDPFNTWKSAFRECVKLASRPIDPKYQEETEDRLHAWCNFGGNKLFGEYAIMGATAGRQFGIDNIANPDQLTKINDFDWLLEHFQNTSTLSLTTE
jgi:hypothetical protein